MMGFFTLLSLLINTVYPVVASCRAYDNYTRVASTIASQNLKIAGVTVPLGLLFDTLKATTGITPELELQRHLISIQKWFIYWIVISVATLFENLLFLNTILPGYSILKLGFSLWLIFPMISLSSGQMEIDSRFDNTDEWKKFTESGAGFLFFRYIKPWIEHNRDKINEVINDPIQSLHLKETTKYLPIVSRYINPEVSKASNYSEPGFLDSSFVMVMNMKNKWTGVEEKVADEFDIIETSSAGEEATTKEGTTVTKRKGFLW
ncbi:uncharacterized protein SPAPADRAFT_69102 [Spathaspora passalidarum NRRL Y-27907]|uniref:Protein YOP1 n=1 Tax=Spathaspora passalidarum (strain NRRL Y-27907 / 11-Y1) TaxID=619300 RepID=G3ADV2_SPAPN|nr:uncharacterized protein SPAPADRAFT_69102 [Spathaspora passalidarum NRRL Y-27907]EGW34676.1 hypothetical protein SPAPADRAFT_69102 [Spathaspora passalidarum NRRL Y-27907]